MAAFEYLALDLAGKEKSGSVAAESEADARERLLRRNLSPVRLQLSKSSTRTKPDAGLFGVRLNTKALTLVTRQLATLVSVAPLEEALRTIAAQAEDRPTRQVLAAVHAAVLEGYRLSEAMARRKESFPALYRAMIASGEGVGALPAILERLADLLERQESVRGKVIGALVYPAMLCVTAVVVVIALMVFVVPKLVEQFDSIGQNLPLLTRIVIGISDFLRAYGIYGLAAGALGLVLFAQALRAKSFQAGFDRMVLGLPLLGKLIRDLHAARLARTLASMTASGLPILEGLLITARTVDNQVLKSAISDMANAIREGGSLSTAMKRAGVFPAILVYMTASGENSGRLESMLERAADYLEREFNTFTSAALALLEPVIIVIMGGVVALIVLSILLPILQLNTLALG
jgi:general secretion pathway protein F